MKRFPMGLAGVSLLLGCLAGPVAAQYANPIATPYPSTAGRPMFNPYAGPPVSPYLNLLRGGNPVVNYFGQVRPQQTFYNTTRLAQQNYLSQQALSAAAATSPYTVSPVMTGVQAQFMNQGAWFMNVNRPQPVTPGAGAQASGQSTTGPKLPATRGRTGR